MASDRALRVSQSIKKEVAEMIQRELRDDRLKGLISITDVECTHDLRSVKIFISVFKSKADEAQSNSPTGKLEDQDQTLKAARPQSQHKTKAVRESGDPAVDQVVEALNEQAGFIRGEVCRRLGLRFAPEMYFRADTSLERGSKVTDLLGKISRGEI